MARTERRQGRKELSGLHAGDFLSEGRKRRFTPARIVAIAIVVAIVAFVAVRALSARNQTDTAVADETAAVASGSASADEDSAVVEATTGISVEGAVSEEGADFLAEALALIPADVTRFDFTHWGRIKEYNGYPEINSSSPRDERTEFMLPVINNSQAAVMMDKEFFLFQEENWGWDSTDLLWEASGQMSDSADTAHILQFRLDFDFVAIIRHLESLEFAEALYGGNTIYTVPLAEDPEWHYRSNLAHHNIAVLFEERKLIMASRLNSVEQLLDVWNHERLPLGELEKIKHISGKLATLAAVEVNLSDAACQLLSPTTSERAAFASLGGDASSAQRNFESYTLGPYALLAVGHQFKEDKQQDLLLMYYDDAPTAELDLESRREMFQEARAHAPTHYSEQLILEEAVVEDGLMSFTISPSESLASRPGFPQTVLGWVQSQDAMFAGCTIPEPELDVELPLN